MADRKVVLCNVLCFVVNKLSYTPLKTLRMVLSDFYSADMLASAKILLMEDTDTLNLATKRPYIPLRRDGDGRLAREVDDNLSLLTFLDEQKALEQLPLYVSDGPDNMPSVRLYEGDLFALTKWMKSMDERMHSLELALAGISTDVRKTQVWPCLPEPDVRCQPQVQSATSVYVCETQSARQPTALSTGPTSAGNSASTVPVSVSTLATAAASSWATMTSSPFAHKNRYVPLGSTTDDDGCMNEQQEPFTTVQPRRQKRSLRRSSSTHENNATGQSVKLVQQRRAPMLLGKSTAGFPSQQLRYDERKLFCA